jgi:putative ABC transport system substrate-binding protein
VELLHELLPAANTIALLANPGNVNIKTDKPEIRAAADRLKQHLEVLTASTERDLEAAFATMVQHRVGSLVVMPDPFFISRSEQLVALAARHAMPAIYPLRAFADLGGLMSYGGGFVDLYQQAGIYVGKILNGAKPADLPIQQSTKVELVINLKTAKALGLTIPPTLLVRADEVVEWWNLFAARELRTWLDLLLVRLVGELIETGTFEQLSRNAGKFSELAERQLVKSATH